MLFTVDDDVQLATENLYIRNLDEILRDDFISFSHSQNHYNYLIGNNNNDDDNNNVTTAATSSAGCSQNVDACASAAVDADDHPLIIPLKISCRAIPFSVINTLLSNKIWSIAFKWIRISWDLMVVHSCCVIDGGKKRIREESMLRFLFHHLLLLSSLFFC